MKKGFVEYEVESWPEGFVASVALCTDPPMCFWSPTYTTQHAVKNAAANQALQFFDEEVTELGSLAEARLSCTMLLLWLAAIHA